MTLSLIVMSTAMSSKGIVIVMVTVMLVIKVVSHNHLPRLEVTARLARMVGDNNHGHGRLFAFTISDSRNTSRL